MIESSMLGRYEYYNSEINSDKFWHIVYDMNQATFVACWGRNRPGNRGAQSKTYTEAEAIKKIREKMKKGYKKISGYDEIIGENAIDWIKRICD
jgi:predicted DNA-binding WGR domain protein